MAVSLSNVEGLSVSLRYRNGLNIGIYPISAPVKEFSEFDGTLGSCQVAVSQDEAIELTFRFEQHYDPFKSDGVEVEIVIGNHRRSVWFDNEQLNLPKSFTFRHLVTQDTDPGTRVFLRAPTPKSMYQRLLRARKC